MKPQKFLLLIIIVLSFQSLFAQTNKSNEKNNEYPDVKENILNEEILLTDNRKIKLADYKNKLIVLSFIEEWAKPICRNLILELNKIHKEDSSRGIEIIGVSFESNISGKPKFRQFVKDFDIQFETGWINKTFDDYFISVSKFQGVPQTFVIYDGKFRGIFSGGGRKIDGKLIKFIKETVENELKK
jgi:cytochrome oxidase Cu insertion factor (SCO1/SenC/PrrC family)